MEYFEDCW